MATASAFDVAAEPQASLHFLGSGNKRRCFQRSSGVQESVAINKFSGGVVFKTKIFKKASFYAFTGALALCLSSYAANAQLEQQTGTADPGRIGEQLRDRMDLPRLSPNIQIQEMELVGAPRDAENITFILGGMKVDGNSVYTAEEIAPLYAGKIGQTVSLADVYSVANQLTLKYRNDGYILTQVVVPPQTIEGGVARLQVVEGYINKVTVQGEGESETELATIRSYVSQVSTNGRAVNVRDMERHLLLINDLPGVRARSILSPSPDKPGAADITVIVERDPFDALITADNYGSRFLGQWTLGGNVNLNSILGQNETISAQAYYAPGTGYELLHGGLGYEQPVGSMGTRLGALASVTDTDPGYTLTQFDVRGRANFYSVYARHPFIRTRNQNLEGKISFDWRDVQSRNNIEPTREDNIRSLRTGLKYDFLDTLLGVSVNTLNVQVVKGLGLFGASDKGDANMTRADADPQFTKAELEIQRLQRLASDVNLQITAKGQIASNALPSSEEFGVGGFYSGRGYDPSEIVGEHGISSQVELQWNNPLFAPSGNVVERVQLYTFVDAGRVWNDDPTNAADKRESLVSTGIGARVSFTSDIEAGAGVALPLTRRVESENDRDPRFYLNISKRF